MFIFARGQPVSLTVAASEAHKMWELWRKGVKPWEYTMSYDEHGNPIVYKDDLDLIFFVDSLNERGIAHEQKKEKAVEDMKKRMGHR